MKKRIHIQSLRIKLPRSMRSSAHSVARTIANDVARTIAGTATEPSGNIAIDEIAVGRVQDVSNAGTKAGEKVGEILNERSRK